MTKTATRIGRIVAIAAVLYGHNVVGSVVNAISTAPVAESTPAHLYHLDTAHNDLVEAVKSTGISFHINPDKCFTEDYKNTFGWYSAGRKEMVICQETKYQANVVSATMTAEDLDTIRHEAQHLIQDCVDGQIDHRLEAVYNEPLTLGKEVFGSAGIEEIRELYSESSDHIQVMEIEAFSVAQLNNPAEQVADIKNYCF